MSANLNKVLLAGRVSIPPQLKSSTGGVTLCNFGIAINHRFRASDGSQREETDFIDLTAFGKTADQCATYLKKGNPVFLEARLKQDTWVDKNTGQNRSRLTLVADRVHFLGGAPTAESAPMDPEVQQAFQQAAAPPQFAPAIPKMSAPPNTPPPEITSMPEPEYGGVPF